MSKSDCRKFAPNIFNKNKCAACFKTKEDHSDEALENNRVRICMEYIVGTFHYSNRKKFNVLVHPIFAFRSGLVTVYNQVFTQLLFSMKHQERDVMRHIHTHVLVCLASCISAEPTPIQHYSILSSG